MTDHPITPPPELVQQWTSKAAIENMPEQIYIATQAANWGADIELEACCHEIAWLDCTSTALKLRAARRPKPPSLADQALAEIQQMEGAMYSADLGCDFTATRAALERLQELEQNND